MANLLQLPTLPTLAERVKWARKKKRWRQEDLADAVGASRAQIQKIETGVITRPRNMEALAEALDVSPIWLQHGDPRLDELTSAGADIGLLWQSLPAADQELARQLLQNMLSKVDQTGEKTGE